MITTAQLEELGTVAHARMTMTAALWSRMELFPKRAVHGGTVAPGGFWQELRPSSVLGDGQRIELGSWASHGEMPPSSLLAVGQVWLEENEEERGSWASSPWRRLAGRRCQVPPHGQGVERRGCRSGST
jgi:hypothetical protein